MAKMRIIEIFNADTPVCTDTVELVQRLVCPWCEVRVLDIFDASVSKRAKRLGIRAVPAVAVDGELVGCCGEDGPTEHDLRAAGIGQPLL